MREFSRSLPMSLLRAREAVMRQFRPSLRQHGLTEQQWRILRALAAIDTIEVTELARAAFLLGPSLSRILRDLEARHLIERRTDQADLRRAVVSISEKGVKQQIAFYGSTPAYRGVLELHGWGDLQTELNALSKQGEWVKMGELIDDDVLGAFAVVAEPDAIGPELIRRYAGVVDRCSFYAPYRSDPERWAAVIATLQAAG